MEVEPVGRLDRCWPFESLEHQMDEAHRTLAVAVRARALDPASTDIHVYCGGSDIVPVIAWALAGALHVLWFGGGASACAGARSRGPLHANLFESGIPLNAVLVVEGYEDLMSSFADVLWSLPNKKIILREGTYWAVV